MFLQQLQGGLIFLPGDNRTVTPARVDNTLKIHRRQLVAASNKYLEQRSPIDLDELRFEKHESGLNIVTCDWWTTRLTDDVNF